MDQWTIAKELEALKKRVDALEGKTAQAPAPEPKKAVKKSAE